MKPICEICFRHCSPEDGADGFCRARGNRGGKIVPLNYGQAVSVALDPIEKKPLRRFHPGGMILSVGSFGCNMRCPFCQNHEISMAGPGMLPVTRFSPVSLAELALELSDRGNLGVAYTYNEPLTCYEFVCDCSKEVHARGMLNVLVTNGMAEEGPWRALMTGIDAVNIDLKGFTEDWYNRLGGSLAAAQRSIRIAAEQCHVEVTTLLIPGENDGEDEIRRLSGWLADIDPDIPLHLSRFFPRYKLTDKPPTPVTTVYALAELARESLHYVYTGNC